MMILAAGSVVLSLASTALGSSLDLALAGQPPPGAPQSSIATPQATEGEPAPSAIEQALIERACTGASSAVAASEDATALCRDTRLLALRSDFGRDLSRLATSERRKLDAACSRFQTPRDREAYLDCLHAELAALSARRRPVNPQAAQPADPAAVDAVPGAPSTAAAPSSLPLILASMGLVVAAGVAGGVFFARARRAGAACRVCQVRISTPGDLCPSCRHEAAEALRRAAAERIERQRAQEDEERRQREEAEALRLQQERVDEDAQMRRLEEARLCEMAREREEEARRADEHADRRRAAASEWPQAGLAGDDQAAFDPYRVLGLAAGATVGQVRAAYEEARQKYDPQQVAHLGDDVQTHYAEKSRAAERAYQMLAGDAEAPPVEAAAEFSRAADYSAARLPAM